MRIASFGSCLSRRIIDQLEFLNPKIDVVSCVMQLKVIDFIKTDNVFSLNDLNFIAEKSTNSLEARDNIIQQHRDVAGIFRNANKPTLTPFKYVFEGNEQVDVILIDNFPELVFRSSVDKNKRRVFIPGVVETNHELLDLQDYDSLDDMVFSYNAFLSHLRKAQPEAKIFFLSFPVSLSNSNNVKERGITFVEKIMPKLLWDEYNIINFKVNKPQVHQMNPNYSHFINQYYLIFAYRILGYFNTDNINPLIHSLSLPNNDSFLSLSSTNVKSYPIRIDTYVESYIWKSKKQDPDYHIHVTGEYDYLLLDFYLLTTKINYYQSVSHEGVIEDLVKDQKSRLREATFLNLIKCKHYLSIPKGIKVVFNDWKNTQNKSFDQKLLKRMISFEKNISKMDNVFLFNTEFDNKKDFGYAFKEYLTGVKYWLGNK